LFTFNTLGMAPVTVTRLPGLKLLAAVYVATLLLIAAWVMGAAMAATAKDSAFCGISGFRTVTVNWLAEAETIVALVTLKGLGLVFVAPFAALITVTNSPGTKLLAEVYVATLFVNAVWVMATVDGAVHRFLCWSAVKTTPCNVPARPGVLPISGIGTSGNPLPTQGIRVRVGA